MPSVAPSRTQLIENADLAFRMGQFAQAEQLATEALKASRTDLLALSILARALLAQNREKEAISKLEKAARRSSDPGIETLLGAALGRDRRRDEAIQLLRQTTQRRPPFIPAFQELAGQLAESRRLDDAIGVIGEAVALDPRNIAVQLDLARLHVQGNDRGQARQILADAAQTAPNEPAISAALARVLLLDGDYAAAADHFRRALALRPNDAGMRADLASCLLEMGERAAGEANLQSALRAGPQMLGRVTYALAHSSHGRFFFRQSDVAKFLNRAKA